MSRPLFTTHVREISDKIRSCQRYEVHFPRDKISVIHQETRNIHYLVLICDTVNGEDHFRVNISFCEDIATNCTIWILMRILNLPLVCSKKLP